MKRINIKLARREKIIVYGGACLLGLFLLLNLVVFPVFSSRTKLRRSIQVGRERIKELMLLGSEYETLKGNSGDIGKALSGRGRGFTLFSLLEKMATKAGLKDSIKYIKPSTSQAKGKYKISSVEMQFEGITMRQLLDYLYRIEDPENIIKVKRLSVKQHKDKSGYVDATLQISTVQMA